MPPIVCIIGKKKSGKTTLTVRVVAELTARRWRVMTVKHGHDFSMDHEGTDTWRHRHEGGARRIVMAASGRFAVLGDWPESGPMGPAELAGLFLADADVVVVEGFKSEPLPKIEIFRQAAHEAPWYDAADPDAAAHYLAVATDVPGFQAPFPVLDADDPDLAARVADIIEARVIGRSPPG